MKVIGASLFIVAALAGCTHIKDEAEPHRSLREVKRQEAFRIYLDTVVANDRTKVYRLHYTLTEPWMTNGMWSGASYFRITPNGTFDIAPLLQSSGGIPSNYTTAIYDSQHHTIEITDIGPNVCLVEALFRPMYPDFCRSTSIKVAQH